MASRFSCRNAFSRVWVVCQPFARLGDGGDPSGHGKTELPHLVNVGRSPPKCLGKLFGGQESVVVFRNHGSFAVSGRILRRPKKIAIATCMTSQSNRWLGHFARLGSQVQRVFPLAEENLATFCSASMWCQ